MHYSRMRTARSSSRQLLGGFASVHARIHPPPRCWPGDHPECGPGDPPGQAPQPLPGGGSGDPPPAARPLNFPPGCGTINTGNKRAVHILLECILVLFCFGPSEFDSHYPRWTTTFKAYCVTTFPMC